MKKRILLTGEDQPLWREFRQKCSAVEVDWTPMVAATKAEGLKLIEASDFAAVVADVNLPDGNGASFLDEVMGRRPRAVRIVLSEIEDTQGTLKCIGKGHHHLLKPCGARELLHTLEGGGAPGTWQPSKEAQALIGRMQRLPSPPTTYFQILTEMRSPEAWIERIGDLIARDPAVTAKVLQLANSAVFGLRLEVAHPRDAVMYIGLEATKALVLLAHTFAAFDRPPIAGFSVEGLWRHSVACGRFARRIAKLETTTEAMAEEAFTAGLLHDIGKLLFAANLPDSFNQALAHAEEHQRHEWELEQELLGASHAEMGACLLGVWGLPGSLVEAVALHHNPGQRKAGGFSTVTAVHVANVLAHEASPGTSAGSVSQVEFPYLEQIGLDQRMTQWRDLCLKGKESGSGDADS